MTYTRTRRRYTYSGGDNRDAYKAVAIIFAVLTAICLAAFIWQVTRATRLTRQIEASRQQAFFGLVDDLQSLETNLSKFVLSSTPSEGAMLLTRVSMQAGEAQSSLAQLPLDSKTLQETMKFVNQTADFARTLIAAAASGRTFNDSDMASITALLGHCTTINNQLRDMLMTTPDKWWVEEGENAAPLTSALDTENSSEYPSLIYDGPFSDGLHEGEAKALSHEIISEDEGLQRAIAFVGSSRVMGYARSADTKGPVASYGYVLDTTDGKINIHVTNKGGEVLWMTPETAQYETTLTIESCVTAAREFLETHGYGEMESSYFQQYNGLAVINFACVQDGVLIYPDLVKVQVRMDIGSVVGVEANNYLMNHTERTDLTPAITVDEAREMTTDRLSVTRERLCVIPRPSGERLAYEFMGTWQGDQYIIYIDALTGKEIDILRIVDGEGGQLTV